jgi:hypothetical protein
MSPLASAGLLGWRALGGLEVLELVPLDRVERPAVCSVRLRDHHHLTLDQALDHAAVKLDHALVVPAQLRGRSSCQSASAGEAGATSAAAANSLASMRPDIPRRKLLINPAPLPSQDGCT